MKQQRKKMKWLDTIDERESEQVQSSLPDADQMSSTHIADTTIDVSMMLENLDICSLDSEPSDTEQTLQLTISKFNYQSPLSFEESRNSLQHRSLNFAAKKELLFTK